MAFLIKHTHSVNIPCVENIKQMYETYVYTK